MHLSKLGQLTLLVASALTIMVGAALAPGLHTVAQALGVSNLAPLLITLPALGAILFAPIFGKAIDRFSPRPVFLVSLWGYFIFGAGGALIHGPVLVGIDRILLGGFAAGVMAAGTAEISHWFKGKDRLNMIAKQGMSIELGGVIFLFIGGILSELHWQAPFLLYVLAFLCVILTAISIPKTARSNDASTQGQDITENTSMRPVILYTIMAMGLFFSMIISLPTLLTQLDFSEAHIGYLLSFISLIAVFSAMVMPKIVMRFSTNTTLMLAFMSYSCAHILFASSEQTSLLILAGIFAGIGFGFSIPLLNHTTVERSSEQTRGRNLSWFAMSVFFGQFATSILEFIPFSHNSALYLCAMIAVFCALLIMKKPVTA